MGCFASYWQFMVVFKKYFLNSKKNTIFFIALYNDEGFILEFGG